MIRPDVSSYRKGITNKAANVLKRYGGGDSPAYNTCPFALAYWLGYDMMHIDPNSSGIEFAIHKSGDYGLVIEFNPTVKDLEWCILYCLALNELGYVKWDTPLYEYSWGNPMLTDLEKMSAVWFADELMVKCKVGEEV